MSDHLKQADDLAEWARSPVLHEHTPEHLSLDLLKRVLTRYILPDRSTSGEGDRDFDPEARENGRDWPSEGETMVGLKRLDNLEFCIADVLQRGVARDAMLREPTRIDAEGFVPLPEGPGLGFELDEERIAAHGEEIR